MAIKNLFFVVLILLFSLFQLLYIAYFILINYIKKIYLFKKIIYTLRYISTDRYDGVIRVLQSISITLFFLQINYNKYTNIIICFLGPLVFGIYLIHEIRFIRKHILRYIFVNNPENSSLYLVLWLVFLKAIKIFIVFIYLAFFLIRQSGKYLDIFISNYYS